LAKHVIRMMQFGYDDECVYVSGSSIFNVYSDLEEAESAYKKLEIEYIRKLDLYDQSSLWDANENFLKEANDFVKAKTGEFFFKGDRPESGDLLPKKMRDEDVLEFGRLADVLGYQLVSYENEPVFYTAWIHDKHDPDWLKEHDEVSSTLLYFESHEELIESIGEWAEQRLYDEKIKGSLEQLSDNPVLLASLLENAKGMNFVVKDGKSYVKFKSVTGSDICALNELLKKPLFEIRQIKIDQVLAIEKEISDLFNEEYGQF
jgi:hypothetical protein